ncbi:MAG: hypothetical protein II543_03300, partial [Desulfovibrio sp.]|nr:hypothetical protein [Desulfovibrio sp.]
MFVFFSKLHAKTVSLTPFRHFFSQQLGINYDFYSKKKWPADIPWKVPPATVGFSDKVSAFFTDARLCATP